MLSANDLGHVEVLLLGQQQGVQALLEVAGAVAVRPEHAPDQTGLIKDFCNFKCCSAGSNQP